MTLSNLRSRWRQSSHPLVRFAKLLIWTPVALYKAAPGLGVRAAYRLGLLRAAKEPLYKGEPRPKPIVVSLTTYGRRASATAPLAITSMMRQSLKPDKIILWLDSDHFSEATLPAALKKLCSRGLEIRYCADISSYKKLVPTALEYPDAYIVTIDDDTYYRSWALAEGYAAALAHPGAVVCGEAYTYVPGLPYRKWPHTPAADPAFTLPVGVGSTWWQPSLLHPDLTNAALFTALAPAADDLWFWTMARLRSVPAYKFAKRCPYIDLDVLHQHYRRSSLSASNLYSGANDSQLAALLTHYTLR